MQEDTPYQFVLRLEGLSLDQLGQAWCKLNCLEWDPILGEPPEDPQLRRQVMHSAFTILTGLLGAPATSWFWWKYKLGKSYTEWSAWYEAEKQYAQKVSRRKYVVDMILATLILLFAVAATVWKLLAK